MVIFMGLCVAGMVVLVGFLFSWFKETAMGGSYLLMLGQRQNELSEARSTAASATGKASARAA
jgi:hypothetical protein